MLKITSLNKYYNKGKQNEIHVVNGIDVELPSSGMVAFFGRSGCGKTTLLNLIGGLDKFESGSISIDGNDIRRDTDVIRNKYVGYIFQNYNLVRSETCFDNVANALRLCGVKDEETIEARTMAALRNVGMEKYRSRTPDTLSGGQMQRIAIARAIVKNPRVILADEPTGNLDEANTVMIMDLLRSIAKDHLVLLVTHEESLVDSYCDKVVELKDGAIVSVRDNRATEGASVKDKNDVYLGELEKSEYLADGISIELFGATPENPIGIKIVNDGTRLLLKVEGDGVRVIDNSSEIRLIEGKYEPRATKNRMSETIDMSDLPEIEGTEHGKLFNFKGAVKSGFANLRKSGKSKKNAVMISCLVLFSIVIVFMCSVFGVSIKNFYEANNLHHASVIYVRTDTEALSTRLSGDEARENGVTFTQLYYGMPWGDLQLNMRVGSFESFSVDGYYDRLTSHAVFLPASLAKDRVLTVGSKEPLTDEMVITTAIADELLETSALGHITDYEDLIGMFCSNYRVTEKALYIAGIVEGDEHEVYLNEMSMARKINSQDSFSDFALASDHGIELDNGKCMLILTQDAKDIPEISSEVRVNGIPLTLEGVKRYYTAYGAWIEAHAPEIPTEKEFFGPMVAEEDPTLLPESDEYKALYNGIADEHYFEYLDVYYSRLDDFLDELAMISSENFELWLYKTKGIEQLRYTFTDNGIYYYNATLLKKEYGVYPSLSYMMESEEMLVNHKVDIDKYYELFGDDFYSVPRHPLSHLTFLVSDGDYIAASRRTGNANDDQINYGSVPYTMLISSDVELTEAWITETLGIVNNEESFYQNVVTPELLYDGEKSDVIASGIASVITTAIMLVTMCACMYFIMRSTLFSRIREIGIYRAIGVSKKNLLFKFASESLFLATSTVFLGYLAATLFISVNLANSPSGLSLFYYPFWLAAALLVLLYAICLFFGTLPVITLLRKTPSEILAKYDI